MPSVSSPVASAKTLDVDEWADGFCNVVEDWQTTASKAHDLVDDVVENGVSTSSKAKSAQKKIVDAFAAASKKSTSAGKAVKALGAPNLANGSKISSTIASDISGIDTLDKVGELDDAFNAAPACSFLTGS